MSLRLPTASEVKRRAGPAKTAGLMLPGQRTGNPPSDLRQLRIPGPASQMQSPPVEKGSSGASGAPEPSPDHAGAGGGAEFPSRMRSSSSAAGPGEAFESGALEDGLEVEGKGGAGGQYEDGSDEEEKSPDVPGVDTADSTTVEEVFTLVDACIREGISPGTPVVRDGWYRYFSVPATGAGILKSSTSFSSSTLSRFNLSFVEKDTEVDFLLADLTDTSSSSIRFTPLWVITADILMHAGHALQQDHLGETAFFILIDLLVMAAFALILVVLDPRALHLWSTVPERKKHNEPVVRETYGATIDHVQSYLLYYRPLFLAIVTSLALASVVLPPTYIAEPTVCSRISSGTVKMFSGWEATSPYLAEDGLEGEFGASTGMRMCFLGFFGLWFVEYPVFLLIYPQTLHIRFSFVLVYSVAVFFGTTIVIFLTHDPVESILYTMMFAVWAFAVVRTMHSSELHRRMAFERIETVRSAYEVKSTNLSRASHEIRTPLNTIFLHVDKANNPTLHNNPAEVKEMVDSVSNCSRHLKELLDTILDVSKIEAGQMSYSNVTCGLAGTMLDATKVARRERITILLSAGSGVPSMVLVDTTRLRQCIVNYLSNAMKFVPAGGGVMLHVARSPMECSRDDHVRLRFGVIDNASGIEPNEAAMLFREYVQASPSRQKTTSGTGLGLSLVKMMAEHYNGCVGLVTRVGVGSAFFFDMELMPVDLGGEDAVIDDGQTQFMPEGSINVDEMAPKAGVTPISEKEQLKNSLKAMREGAINSLRILVVVDSRQVKLWFKALEKRFKLKIEVTSTPEEAVRKFDPVRQLAVIVSLGKHETMLKLVRSLQAKEMVWREHLRAVPRATEDLVEFVKITTEACKAATNGERPVMFGKILDGFVNSKYFKSSPKPRGRTASAGDSLSPEAMKQLANMVRSVRSILMRQVWEIRGWKSPVYAIAASDEVHMASEVIFRSVATPEDWVRLRRSTPRWAVSEHGGSKATKKAVTVANQAEVEDLIGLPTGTLALQKSDHCTLLSGLAASTYAESPQRLFKSIDRCTRAFNSLSTTRAHYNRKPSTFVPKPLSHVRSPFEPVDPPHQSVAPRTPPSQSQSRSFGRKSRRMRPKSYAVEPASPSNGFSRQAVDAEILRAWDSMDVVEGAPPPIVDFVAPKPVDLQALHCIFVRALQSRDVLVAEDSPGNAKMYRRHIVETGGHRVAIVEEGQAVIDFITRMHQLPSFISGLPDVVLTDHGLKDSVSGTDVVTALRKPNSLSVSGGPLYQGPILLISGASDLGGEWYSAGADGHLMKPCRSVTLLCAISHACMATQVSQMRLFGVKTFGNAATINGKGPQEVLHRDKQCNSEMPAEVRLDEQTTRAVVRSEALWWEFGRLRLNDEEMKNMFVFCGVPSPPQGVLTTDARQDCECPARTHFLRRLEAARPPQQRPQTTATHRLLSRLAPAEAAAT